jgi:hypothetical protein
VCGPSFQSALHDYALLLLDDPYIPHTCLGPVNAPIFFIDHHSQSFPDDTSMCPMWVSYNSTAALAVRFQAGTSECFCCTVTRCKSCSKRRKYGTLRCHHYACKNGSASAVRFRGHQCHPILNFMMASCCRSLQPTSEPRRGAILHVRVTRGGGTLLALGTPSGCFPPWSEAE